MKVAHIGTNSYTRAIDDANARHKRGERQVYCGIHSLWHWPDQVLPECTGHTYTAAGYRRLVAEAQKLADAMEAKRAALRDARKRGKK